MDFPDEIAFYNLTKAQTTLVALYSPVHAAARYVSTNKYKTGRWTLRHNRLILFTSYPRELYFLYTL